MIDHDFSGVCGQRLGRSFHGWVVNGCVAGNTTIDAPEVEQASRFAVRELADGEPCRRRDVLFLAYSNLKPERR
ncbi:MAG: hypothetical protein ACE5HE_02745, partial [Phycisphaerae bacterium]